MTKLTDAELLALIASWRTGDCPGEVLCDAISEYGIDVDDKQIFDASLMFFDTNIRYHLDSCSRKEHHRRTCVAMKWLESQLLQPAK